MALKGSFKKAVELCDVGDYITLKYSTDTEDTVGTFSYVDDLKTEQELDVYRYTKEIMCNNSDYVVGQDDRGYIYKTSNLPNGTFNAVCVKKLDNDIRVFFPDRILQRYISYNTAESAGLIDGTYKIYGKRIHGTAQIMSYDEIMELLPIFEKISTDYRYDLGVPALGHSLGGGYYDSLVSFNSIDGHYSGYDCLEMTRDTHYNDDGVKVARYIADYERYYDDKYLYVGSEHESVKISIPRYWETNYLSHNFYSGLVACITNSAIRPLLYLSSNYILYDTNTHIYGIPK